jgi:phage terminase small subunit
MAKKRKKARPRLRTDARRSRFVVEYLRDMNGTKAAIRAGYSKSCARQIASRLLSQADMRSDIKSAMAERAKRTEWTADRVLEQLQEDHDGAVIEGQYASAVRADELLGRHLGMFAKEHKVELSMSLHDLVVQAGNVGILK